MPKLDDTHLPERIKKRIDKLEAGEDVAAKNIRAVLTDEQIAELDAAWSQQQQLRKDKRVTTIEQQQELGWKTKREVRLDVLKNAHAVAMKNIVAVFADLQRKSTVRQMRIYMDTMIAATEAGHDPQQAKDMANNALTRAGLSRMDRRLVQARKPRDKDEENLKKLLNITEQEEDLNAHIIVKKRRVLKKG